MTVSPDDHLAGRTSQVRRACRAVAKPPDEWPPEPGLNDHRLVLFAARPALDVLAMSRFGLLLSAFERTGFNATPGTAARGIGGSDMTKERKSRNMRLLVLACDEVAELLSPEELAAVRANGQLPTWFVPVVHEHARVIRRHWPRG